MLFKEMVERVNKAVDEYGFNYGKDYYVGIRFENKARTIGEIIEDCSRSNIDREDERDFPEYGTEEYYEMEELDGICAWNAEGSTYGWEPYNKDRKIENQYETDHCYLLISKFADYGEDENEIIMKDAKVIDAIF